MPTADLRQGSPRRALASGAVSCRTKVFWGQTVVAQFLLDTCVLSVIGAVKAYRRTWWRYPLTPYRFVRGARAARSTT